MQNIAMCLPGREGNIFLVDHFINKLQGKIRTGALVTAIRDENDKIRIEYLDVKKNQLKAFEAKQCIVAMPQFIAARLLNDTARLVKVNAKNAICPMDGSQPAGRKTH